MSNTKDPFALTFENSYGQTLFGGPGGRQTRPGGPPKLDAQVQFVQNHVEVVKEKARILNGLLGTIGELDKDVAMHLRVEVATLFATALDELSQGLELPREVMPEEEEAEEAPPPAKATPAKKRVARKKVTEE